MRGNNYIKRGSIKQKEPELNDLENFQSIYIAQNKKMGPPIFIAVLFTVAKCWKQPKCPSVNEWLKKLWSIYAMEYYTAERKKELLPFATAWMELESIMLSEISQSEKEKYHVISPLSGTESTKQTSEQNTTRAMEIKSKLTVTRGEGEDKGGKKGKGRQGTCIKDPWTKPKGGRIEGGRWGEWWGENGDNCT